MGCCGRGKGGVAVGPRRVLVGDAEGTEAANPAAVPTDNVVVTSKYNIITFCLSHRNTHTHTWIYMYIRVLTPSHGHTHGCGASQCPST